MTALEVFTYSDHRVRTLSVDGEPWLVAVDVTAALGLGNGRDAVGRLDPDGVGTADVIDSMGRVQSARIVSEAGLYELIFQSRVPAAKAFKHWVTRYVLPTIRKTGTYAVQETPEQVMARGLVAAQQMLEAAKHQVAELEPRARAWDELASAEGDYEIGDAAKMLARAGIDVGRQRLFDRLSEMGWLFRGRDRRWRCYQTAVDQGYMAEKPGKAFDHPVTGTRVLGAPQPRVTVRGLERLRVRLQAASALVELSSQP